MNDESAELARAVAREYALDKAYKSLGRLYTATAGTFTDPFNPVYRMVQQNAAVEQAMARLHAVTGDGVRCARYLEWCVERAQETPWPNFDVVMELLENGYQLVCAGQPLPTDEEVTKP